MKKVMIMGMSLLVAISVVAQDDTASEKARDAIAKAEARLASATMAGARNYASAIYDEAVFRLGFAAENLDSEERRLRSQAIARAVQAWRAAEAAEAKAKWLSTTDELRSLRAEIERLGGNPPAIIFLDETTATIDRGNTTMEKVDTAEWALERARKANAGIYVGDELQLAENYIKSARGIAQANERNSSSAEHLAYVAEMIARRAWYLAQLQSLAPRVPELRNIRVDLVQADIERQAAAERAERAASERRAAELREQLERERRRRQAEQAEIERLRNQIREQQEFFAARLTSDRAARVEAERRLDSLRARYEEALTSEEVDARELEELRQRLERQRFELLRLRREETRSEETVLAELREIRTELREERERGRIPAQVVAERERHIDEQTDQIERLRRQREETLRERAERERAFRERVEVAERNLREVELESERLQEQMTEERLRAERAEAELERVREEMRGREEEAERRERERAEKMEAMEQRLSELADTREEERGFIVTLPGLFFDTGKATLKSGTKSNLAKIAEQVVQVPDVIIVVEGHTDSVGSEELNQRLSEQRAIAVRNYLVSQGVSPTVITTIGRGEREPIASNDTAAGRAQNRRVDLVITMRE